MTPHKAIEVLKELKPGDRWKIEMSMLCQHVGTVFTCWVVEQESFDPLDRQYWEGSTLDEAMEKVLESLKV